MFVIARAVAWGRLIALLTVLGNAAGMLLLSVFFAGFLGTATTVSASKCGSLTGDPDDGHHESTACSEHHREFLSPLCKAIIRGA